MSPLRHVGEGASEHSLAKEFEGLAQLLFEWPIRQAPRLALPLCILLAAIIQAGMMILFSISYSTPSDRLPSSPQIYFLPADSHAASQLAPWLEANDPAVFSPQYDTKDAIPAPPPLKYRPSYEEPPPQLLPLPSPNKVLAEPPMPEQRTSLIPKRRMEGSGDSAFSPSAPVKTVVHWQDDLEHRSLRSPTPPPQAAAPLAQPALYEVGVSAEGLPMHSVLLESSGDPASDERGSVWINSQRFEPSSQFSWGRVLILWGTPADAPSPPLKP